METRKLHNLSPETLRSMHAYASAWLASSTLAGVPPECLKTHCLYISELEAALKSKGLPVPSAQGAADEPVTG